MLVNRETPEQAAYHCMLVAERLEEALEKRGVVVRTRAGLAPLDGSAAADALAAARAAAN